MKKRFLFLFIIILFSTTGCVSYTELNELGIISAIAIEKEEEQFLITTNFIIPKKTEGKSSYETKIYQSKGISIEEALNNIYLKSNKKIYLSHLDLVAIDQEIAKKNIEEVISFFLQNEESRNAFPIILVENTSPSKLLELEDAKDTIGHLLEINGQEHGTTFFLSLEDFAKMLLEENSAVLPTIELKEVPVSKGLAIMNHDTLVGYLDEIESNAYLYLTDRIEKINLTIPCSNQSPTEIQVKESSTLISNQNNKIIIEIQSKIQGNSSNCKEDIKKLYETEILTRINSLIERTKKEQLDLLHFTSFIYRNDYSYYKKNKENLFKNLSYEIIFQTEEINKNQKLKGEFHE